MNSADGEEKVREIVIVRRRSDIDEDAHHGGVWKVAFADFMTAMMAFFLVLWIVNSTTREVKTSLARYFNPIKLAESTPAKKGLTDSKDQQDELAAEKGDEKAKSGDSSGEIKDDGKSQGPPPRLDARSKQNGAPRSDTATPGDLAGEGSAQPHSIDSFRDPFERRPAERAQSSDPARAQTDTTATALRAELAKMLGAEEFAKLDGHIDVKAEPEGLLISLSDGLDFGMFAIGSAEPEARLVRVLSAIAQSLRTRAGGLVVRGHTDARPFRGGQYDNWQLSSARAQASYHILMRAGIDERRIERIEGYADRKLKKATDAMAPENRRIEILIRKDKP